MFRGLPSEVWREVGKANMELVIAAVAAAAATIITALRKRRDVDVVELNKRVSDLTQRVESLESTLDLTRDELIVVEHDRFVLRRTLAAHGIQDPTAVEAS